MRSGTPPEERPAPQADARPHVEFVDAAAFAGLEAAWRGLADAATEANAFAEPAVLAAAAVKCGTRIVVMLAWDPADRGRLVGAWTFARLGGARPRLRAPAVPLAGLGSPVIRAGWHEAVIEAWFEALSQDRRWPKILELNPTMAEDPGGKALWRVIARRRCDHAVIQHRQRAELRSPLSGEAYLARSVSGSRRRKLRQLRARLERQGAVAYRRHEAPAAVASATERFLTLEESGWKGRRGTAMGRDPRLAAFVRAAMPALAEQGLASVTELTLDGQAVSMGLVLRSGRTAYTFKIAYDEALGAFSPGYLLALEDTATFLGDPRIDRVDSCASEAVGILSEIWQERIALCDLYLDVRRGPTLSFGLAMGMTTLVEAVPRLRRRLSLRQRIQSILKRVKMPRAPSK